MHENECVVCCTTEGNGNDKFLYIYDLSITLIILTSPFINTLHYVP